MNGNNNEQDYSSDQEEHPKQDRPSRNTSTSKKAKLDHPDNEPKDNQQSEQSNEGILKTIFESIQSL